MATKHSIAKDALAAAKSQAADADLTHSEVLEAMLSHLIEGMKEAGTKDLRGLLQYEVECLGSDGIHELPRGGGHS